MKNFTQRLLIGLCFAIPLAGLALFFSQIVADARVPAQDNNPPTTNTNPLEMSYDDCAKCHQDVVDRWQPGAHGHALSDPIFSNAWNIQGKPGQCLVCHATGYDPTTSQFIAEGVTCQSCHDPIPADHPNDNAPVEKTPELCGKCHSDPRFATENWKLSAHYQRNMTCTVCHDPHTAGMKSIEGAEVIAADASDLCANCHKDAMQNFPTSKHAEAGVSCVNCHLGYNVEGADTSADLDAVHKAPDHNFQPKIETCNACHSTQMHGTGEAVAAAAIKIEEIGGTATPEPTAAVTPVPAVQTNPNPVSPTGFAMMAGLLGLAGGMVLAPWLERLYRHFIKGGQK